MSVKLHFNFKDVFRAPRFGLSAKKIWVQLVGLVVGLLLYTPLTYWAFAVAGYDLGQVWSFYHLLPVPFLTGEYALFPLGAKVIWWVGVLLFFVVWLHAGVAVAKIAYEQLKGDEFYEASKGFKFALSKGKATVLAPFVILVIAVLVLVAELVVFYLGRIPVVGPYLNALFFFPAFLMSLFVIYLGLGFFVSFFVVPPAVATTKADTFDGIFETFSVLNEQNWRFVAYEILLLGVKALAVVIFGFFASWAVKLSLGLMSVAWPRALYAHDVAVRFADWFSLSPVLSQIAQWAGFGAFIQPAGYMATKASTVGAGILLGLVYYLITFVILAFCGSVWWVGQTLIYIVLSKKKDNIDLLAQRPEAVEEIILEERDEASKQPDNSPSEDNA